MRTDVHPTNERTTTALQEVHGDGMYLSSEKIHIVRRAEHSEDFFGMSAIDLNSDPLVFKILDKFPPLLSELRHIQGLRKKGRKNMPSSPAFGLRSKKELLQKPAASRDPDHQSEILTDNILRIWQAI